MYETFVPGHYYGLDDYERLQNEVSERSTNGRVTESCPPSLEQVGFSQA